MSRVFVLQVTRQILWSHNSMWSFLAVSISRFLLSISSAVPSSSSGTTKIGDLPLSPAGQTPKNSATIEWNLFPVGVYSNPGFESEMSLGLLKSTEKRVLYRTQQLRSLHHSSLEYDKTLQL